MGARTEGIDLLRQAGISHAATSPTRMLIAGSDVRVFSPTTPPAPSVIERDLETIRGSAFPEDILLYVLSRAPESLRRRALEDSKIAYISTSDSTIVFQTKKHVVTNSADPTSPKLVRRPAWGRLAIARALLRTGRPQTQVEIAKAAGITQAAVSQALKALGDHVARNIGSDTGWLAKNPDELFTYAVRDYPGPGGITTYWYGLDNLATQAELVLDYAGPQVVLLAGDSAADQISPWRRMRRASVFSKTGFDLRPLGFAQTEPQNATLEFTVPADNTIWATAQSWYGETVTVTDPIIAAWTVRDIGGSDADEAETRLRGVVIRNWIATR
jgi:hypothetical protein